MRQHNNLFVILSVVWYENEYCTKGNKGKKGAQIFSHKHKSNENTNKLIHKQNKIKLNHTAQG